MKRRKANYARDKAKSYMRKAENALQKENNNHSWLLFLLFGHKQVKNQLLELHPTAYLGREL